MLSLLSVHGVNRFHSKPPKVYIQSEKRVVIVQQLLQSDKIPIKSIA